jgi:hypothetical protein
MRKTMPQSNKLPAIDTELEDRLNSCLKETLGLLDTHCDPACLALIMSVRWDIPLFTAEDLIHSALAIKQQQ